ncbi:hypothetical protein NL676_021077 [Syzygium grande]|nr:hypothetical protein NL676_021077 [Syzygium grande]
MGLREATEEVAAAEVKRKTLHRNGGEGVDKLAEVRTWIGGTKSEDYREGRERRVVEEDREKGLPCEEGIAERLKLSCEEEY